MSFKIVFYILFILTYLLSFPSSSQSAEITMLEVSLQDNNALISTAVSLDDKHLEDMRKGIKKEIRFYIDIFKTCNF